ncbi:MAG: hypothetical protein KAJ14_09245, partial [Candidatus Omnitrophica bacterium]|nr:hypothetical protein [Candidatus Omnitrophota bacterium]
AHWFAVLEYLKDVEWEYAEWKEGKPIKKLKTIATNDANPETGLSDWGFKTDNWTYALRVVDEEDGVVFNTDREHTIFPVDVFLLPFVAYEFTKRKDLGLVTTNLKDADEGMTPVAKDQSVAEDVWNTRVIATLSRIGISAMYGPCIIRLPAMRNFGANASKIEDSATAHEVLKAGYKVDYAPGITMGRGREKTMGGMPAFVNRFGGLTLDNHLTVHYQQLMASLRMHWTEKISLIFNDDHYITQVIIPKYNLIIFLFAFFVSFTPFAYLAFPLAFITLQYIFSQAIAAGGVRLYVKDYGYLKGYVLYIIRFWSLVFTFLSLIPNDAEKTATALKGESGVFKGGEKDVKYPAEKFNDLYEKYRSSIKWGVLLLAILLIAPLHPYGVAGQFFFYVFPFAFIFGPFMHNRKGWLNSIGYALRAGVYSIFYFLFLDLGLSIINSIKTIVKSLYVGSKNKIKTSGLNKKQENEGSKDEENQDGGKETGKETVDAYLKKALGLLQEGTIQKLRLSDINFEMTSAQKDKYLQSIKNILEERNEEAVTPTILFQAAKAALEGEESTVTGKIGLQPGTMNPLHYGHVSASLAGIIGREIDAVLLANGGTVPDKPYAASADIRNEMARKAVDEDGLRDFLQVTPVRAQTVDMFTKDIAMAGKDENARRFNMDMAAFIWLFAANPKIEWFYLVGSDKVAGYGKKDEKGLLLETLKPAKVKAVYFARTGEDINYEEDIAKYDWMKELWEDGFFEKSAVSSFADLSATKVRVALVEEKDNVEGVPLTESISSKVIEYILSTKELIALYKIEMNEKAAKKLVKSGEYQKAITLYEKSLYILNTIGEIRESEKALFEVAKKKTTYHIYILGLTDILVKGSLNYEKIEDLSVLEMADILRNLDLSRYSIEEKMLIYSGAPGSGKGALMDRSFGKGAPYKDLVSQLLLYHSRKARNEEVDGKKYQFGNENVGTKDNRLVEREREGKIITTFVNKQLQGVAREEFIEEVIVRPGNPSEMLLSGDIVIEENGKIVEHREVKKETEVKELTKVKRIIKGLSEAFDNSKLTVLEGGYGWFQKLSKENQGVFTIFLSPFTYSQVELRGKNQKDIAENYEDSFERFVAYAQLNIMRKAKKVEELDLRYSQTLNELQRAVIRWFELYDYNYESIPDEYKNIINELDLYSDIEVEDKDEVVLWLRNEESELIKYLLESEAVTELGRNPADKITALKNNAKLIESDKFEKELNHSLIKYFKHTLRITDENIHLAHALAYELQMKLARDVKRGDTSFELKVPDHAIEDAGEFSSPEDMFNRVVEGVIQVMNMKEYERNGKGAIVLNTFVYKEEEVKGALQKVADDFCGIYFKYLLKEIAKQEKDNNQDGGYETGKETVDAYLEKVTNLLNKGKIQKISSSDINFEMTSAQK